MEDEKGLDLSLGLPCGANTSSQKSRVSSSSDLRLNEDDRDRKMINEFKNFLEGGNQHSLKFGESYCSQYAAKASSLHIETSKSLNNDGGNWLTNETRPTDYEDEGRSVLCEKRKNMFTKIEPKKKHAAEVNHGDFTENAIGDEGSTGENEDVADSETDGSSSKHVPSSDGFGDSENTDKMHRVSSEKELKVSDVSMPYGGTVSFPAQPAAMSIPFSQAVKDLKASGTLCLPNYPLPGIVHAERSSAQPVHQPNFPLTFGYSSAQLPTLDRDNSRGIISSQQQVQPAFRNHTTQDSIRYDDRISEHGKQQVEESSSHMKNDPKDRPSHHQEATIPSEFQAIRPGIAADLKFGGSGSYPNLPWVSTTSPNPNGRTISGVTYRFSPTQIMIVCACHGSHMSPEEFVRHASEDAGAPPPDSASALASLPNNNPATSGRS